MFLEVNNKKTIQKLVRNSVRTNKYQNLFAIAAILLTTVLFTGLFTVAGSLIVSMEESTMRQVGGNAHGGFKYLTMEQYDRLKTHKSIKNISYSVVLGVAENQELSKRPSELRYASSEINAKGFFAMPSTGRLPQKDNEMATDTIVLERLGIEPSLGQKITLEYSIGSQKLKDTFELVGFWEGDILMQASQVWLNQSYVDTQLEKYGHLSSDKTINTINADVNFSNSRNIEKKLIKVITDSGYTVDEIQYGVNWAYTGNDGPADLETIIGAAVFILMIMFCGYLMISNVFYISVAKDIRYYGLLKTIGTTGRQIRIIIRRQALLLCLQGLPIGLFMGYLTGFFLTPVVLSLFTANVIKVSFDIRIFIASALFVILTVFISIKKPSKIASRVSPIEALRSNDNTEKSHKNKKKNSSFNLLSMAFANVFRNRKKAVLVTISLSLSLIILNTAYSIANSFDMDEYLSALIESDFAIGDTSYFNVNMYYTNQDTLNNDFLKELSRIDGVSQINNIYFSEPEADTDPRLLDLAKKVEQEGDASAQWLDLVKSDLKSSTQLQHIYGLAEPVFDKLEVLSGTIDVKKLKTGNYVIAAPYDEKVSIYKTGDKVKLETKDGPKEFEVLAIATIPYNISIRHRHPIALEFFIPDEVFLNEIEEKAPMLTLIETEDGLEEKLEAYLSDYCENWNQNMQYESKATLAAEYESTKNTFQSVGIVLSILVGFIGIMNFINTSITSIISRKHELAMLQSIGMTNSQMQGMLMGEGFLYALLTALFILTIGWGLEFMGMKAVMGGGYVSLKNLTVIPSLACLPVLAAISVIVPLASQKVISRKSVVERLREAE